MKLEKRQPFTLGCITVISIVGTLAISIITMIYVSTAYKMYQENQNYIVHTQAYYVADGEATVKRALIEEALREAYYSKYNIVYDLKHIKRAIRDIKDIELIETEEKTMLIRYEELITIDEKLSVELEAKPIERGQTKSYLTEVKRWQIIKE